MAQKPMLRYIYILIYVFKLPPCAPKEGQLRLLDRALQHALVQRRHDAHQRVVVGSTAVGSTVVCNAVGNAAVSNTAVGMLRSAVPGAAVAAAAVAAAAAAVAVVGKPRPR